MTYADFLKDQEEVNALRAARARSWSSWLWCMSLGAIGSVVRSVQTKNWKPTLVGTAVAVPCLGLAAVDSGFTLMVAPPVAAATTFTLNTNAARKRFGFYTPEQADAALFEKAGSL